MTNAEKKAAEAEAAKAAPAAKAAEPAAKAPEAKAAESGVVKGPEPEKAPEPKARSAQDEEEALARKVALENDAALNVPAGRPVENAAPDLASEQGRLASYHAVLEENEQRDEANREGHEKNMDEIARLHEEGHAKETAPASGKARDINTPRIDKDGNKTW